MFNYGSDITIRKHFLVSNKFYRSYLLVIMQGQHLEKSCVTETDLEFTKTNNVMTSLYLNINKYSKNVVCLFRINTHNNSYIVSYELLQFTSGMFDCMFLRLFVVALIYRDMLT